MRTSDFLLLAAASAVFMAWLFDLVTEGFNADGLLAAVIILGFLGLVRLVIALFRRRKKRKEQ